MATSDDRDQVEPTPRVRAKSVAARGTSNGADAAPAKRTADRRPAEARPERRGGDDAPNPVWFKPIMFGLMLLGLLWIIVFYVSGTTLPIEQLGDGNILVGFGILFLGFLMTTQWR